MSEQITEAAKKGHFWVFVFFGGGISALIAGMGVASYFGSFAKAETVAKIETRQQVQAEHIAAIEAIVPIVKATFEIERAEQYRLHHIIIPDPPAPASPEALRTASGTGKGGTVK